MGDFGFGGGMGGQIADWIKTGADDMKRDQVTLYNMYDANRRENTRHSEWNTQMNFATDAYYNRYSNTVADLQRAGLNPMLAVTGGQPPAAGGSAGTGAPHPGSVDAGAYRNSMSLAGAANSAQQARLAAAQVDLTQAAGRKVDAETKAVEQSTNESRARTTTYAPSVAKLEQEVRESVSRMNELATRAVSNVASAGQAEAHARYFEESLSQIRATVDLLKAQTGEVGNKVKANLPEIERRLKDAEVLVKEPESYRLGKVWQHEFSGTIGALLKVFNPLAGMIAVMK